MSSDPVIRVNKLSKSFPIYAQPSDRLKQFIFPRLQRLFGLSPKKYYRAFDALSDVSFEIQRGETVGIIGRNGAGKSTLLQILCGTLAPTSGEVQIKGRIAALLELGAGFNAEYSGRENVYMNARILGLSDSEIDARFEEIIAFADIGEHIDQPVKTYSSGMYVRLAFAVIAHVDADILVIDEALAVGDALFTQKCMRYLRNFQLKGTILFVSHDVSSVVSLCQRAIWLNKGSLKMQGSPKEIVEIYLENIYEAQQGPSSFSSPSKVLNVQTVEEEKEEESLLPLQAYDARLNYINHSIHRNDIEIFSFKSDAKAFGKRGAEIRNVVLKNSQNRDLNWVVGGELVTLQVTCVANQTIICPIVGFFVKDRLGQVLFGDNTYLTYSKAPIYVDAGIQFRAIFDFYLPILPAGDYSITVALAEGTQQDHIQHHWIHDALLLRSTSSSVSTGLIGIPIKSIKFVQEII
jgi:lipopolysaccharide transport system ATP-binding protein